MGRRKIEIQPITHERNRSVTFLKRKNGLFKKAYELGVLCSVDVAVIIFEERPGHHVKLYQYCSGNIDDIVQRHSRYDGEKDTRTPNDFTNHPSVKHEDAVEGDDDEAEDEEPEPVIVQSNGIVKRGRDTGETGEPSVKLRQSTISSNGLPMQNTDYLIHRTTAMPNIPLPTGNLSLPTSGERLSTARPSSGDMQNGGPNKKPRLAPSMSVDRLPQEDMGPPVSGSRRYGYHPASAPPSYRGPPQFPAYFPGSSAQQSIPSGNGFDYPSSRGQFRPTNGATRPVPPYNQHPETHQFMRQYQQQHQNGHSPMTTPNQQQQPQHSGDIFATFLDGNQRQQSAPGFGAIDWPVHAPGQGGRSEQGDPNDASWLDFLSGHPAPSGVIVEASPPLSSSDRDIISWQRDRPPAVNGTIALEPASRSPSLARSPKMVPNRRSRAASGVDDRLGSECQEDEMKPTAFGGKASKTPQCGNGEINPHNDGNRDGGK